MANFYHRFLGAVRSFPDNVAFEMQRESGALERYTYEQTRRMVESIGRWLAESGLPRGARCAILAANGPRWVATYLGILAAGHAAVPFDTAFNAAQVSRLLKDSGASLLFADAKHLPVALEAMAAAPVRLVTMVAVEGVAAPHLDQIFAAGPDGFVPAELADDDPAAILYTSGTTSDPKGVTLSHANIEAEADGALSLLSDLDSHDALLGVLPLFHALAQLANLLLPIVIGARVVFLESLNTAELLRALRERNITVFACVPQFFYLIHSRIMQEVSARGRLAESAFLRMMAFSACMRRVKINLGPLLFSRVHKLLGARMRYLVSGGSRLDPQIAGDFYALGFTLLNGYGLTESSGAATVTPPRANVIGSVGRPLKGVEVKILDPHLDDSGRAVGEIAIRGAIVMQGYYNRPDATAEAIRNGWLHTGDVGCMDASGTLFITGRAKEVIVLSSGKNVYPEEIETHLLRSPFIKEICVLGMESRPGEPIAERLHAVVVPDFEILRERHIVNAKEVLRYEIEGLSAQLPPTKRILSYDIWQDELPRTTTRKVRRHEVERRVRQAMQAGGSAEAQVSPEPSPQERQWMEIPEVQRALEIVRRASKFPQREVLPGDNLELDLGLDSMERVELLVSLEKELGADVEDSVVSEVYTVRELVEAVRSRIGAGGATHAVAAWGAILNQDPSEPEILAISERRTLAAMFWFAVGRVVHLLSRDLFSLRVSGLEKLPRAGPFILSPNHQSFLDAPVLLSILPWSVFKRQFSVGTSEIFGAGIARRIARSFNLVPVDPDANLVPAMRAGAYGLRQGKALILFPEGERSIDGTPKRFKKGAAILAANLNVPIYPVALDGFHEAWPRGKGLQRLSPLKIAIGDPILPNGDAANPEVRYDSITTELRARVMRMWEQLHEISSRSAVGP